MMSYQIAYFPNLPSQKAQAESIKNLKALLNVNYEFPNECLIDIDADTYRTTFGNSQMPTVGGSMNTTRHQAVVADPTGTLRSV
jgi:hypothetical protein